MKRFAIPLVLCGICAGAVNGLLGSGGGMVLVPLLTLITDLNQDEIFPASVCIILPICVISLLFSGSWDRITFRDVSPYLLGSVAGGLLAGLLGKRIPTRWLHRILGILILLGGIRYLC